MKSVLSLVVLGLAMAVTAPAIAEDVPTTQADCEAMDGMQWDEETGTCIKQ